jgi:hypothetical protein
MYCSVKVFDGILRSMLSAHFLVCSPYAYTDAVVLLILSLSSLRLISSRQSYLACFPDCIRSANLHWQPRCSETGGIRDIQYGEILAVVTTLGRLIAPRLAEDSTTSLLARRPGHRGPPPARWQLRGDKPLLSWMVISRCTSDHVRRYCILSCQYDRHPPWQVKP